MLLAMREYSGPDPSKPTIQPTQPGQETFESWAKERLVVGEERAGIFYETDHFGRPLRVDINGRLRQLRHYIWSFFRISQHCTIPPCDDALYPVPMRIGCCLLICDCDAVAWKNWQKLAKIEKIGKIGKIGKIASSGMPVIERDSRGVPKNR